MDGWVGDGWMDGQMFTVDGWVMVGDIGWMDRQTDTVDGRWMDTVDG